MKNSVKVVLDTNIFINGLFNDSVSCSQILDCIDKRTIRLYFSQDTIGELFYVIKNFARNQIDSPEEREDLLHNISDLFLYSMSVNTKNTETKKSKDKYDDMFIECAETGKVNYLISDDIKSGLHEMQFEKFKVLNSIDFVKTLEERLISKVI
ncbi:MAG: putative toxin-antitoxin system toxin component, PIN family [Oscillospiraceae bacterium]|nr:putative toxin-antitoxin system toxin component, PIN family [Oscillospiraceae bacterium]MDD4413204.1 putative toxin-antitoxin system toxin component, PIN family [Oscillospiraceae bacterium]